MDETTGKGRAVISADTCAMERVLFPRRVTILAGHFGSGKTEIALNGALGLAAGGLEVSLVDLDVVKPYFRSRSAREFLRQAGVELVAPEGEFFSSDLPIILPQVRGALGDRSRKVLMDAGGDDTGARVVGSLTDAIPVGETDFLLVLNFRRPFTPDADSALVMAREIEATARLKITGLISNTHLMKETTLDVVMAGHDMALRTSSLLGIPLVALTVKDALLNAAQEAAPGCPVIPLRPLVKPAFEEERGQRKVGPLFVVG